MLLSFFRVEGHSMEPSLKNGSFFMASSIPFMFVSPKVADVIIFKNDNKIIVKKISKIEKGKYFLNGENLVDSKNFGAIERNEILGKVIWTH